MLLSNGASPAAVWQPVFWQQPEDSRKHYDRKGREGDIGKPDARPYHWRLLPKYESLAARFRRCKVYDFSCKEILAAANVHFGATALFLQLPKDSHSAAKTFSLR